MHIYNIYKHPVLGTEVIKQGFSWPAFFLGWLWALFKKLWVIGTVFIAVFLIISVVTEAIIGYRVDPGEAFGSLILYFIPMLVMGFNGNNWLKASMEKRGFKLVSSIEAESADGALSKVPDLTGTSEETPSIPLDDILASKAMYEIISDELDDDRAEHALWMQSLEQSGGDTNKQNAIYLKLRSTLFLNNLSKANQNLNTIRKSSLSDNDPPCDRDLLSDVYRIWLMAKYSIDRQKTSGDFYHSGKSFASLNKAIAFAHVLDKQESEKRKENLAHQQLAEREENARKQAVKEALAEQRKAQEQKAKELRKKRMPWIAGLALFITTAIGVYAWEVESEYRLEYSIYINNVTSTETELSEAEASVDNLNERINSLKAERSQIVTRNYSRLSEAGNKLKKEQFEMVRVTVDWDSTKEHYYVTVRNHSNNYVGNMEGILSVYVDGHRAFDWEPPIKLDLKYTANNNWHNKDYAVAPKTAAIVKNSIGEDWQLPIFYRHLNIKSVINKELKKFIKNKNVSAYYGYLGTDAIKLDSEAKFKGTITFVTKPIPNEKNNDVTYSTTPIDFTELVADELPVIRTIKEELSKLEGRKMEMVMKVENRQRALNKVKEIKPSRKIVILGLLRKIRGWIRGWIPVRVRMTKLFDGLPPISDHII